MLIIFSTPYLVFFSLSSVNPNMRFLATNSFLFPLLQLCFCGCGFLFYNCMSLQKYAGRHVVLVIFVRAGPHQWLITIKNLTSEKCRKMQTMKSRLLLSSCGWNILAFQLISVNSSTAWSLTKSGKSVICEHRVTLNELHGNLAVWDWDSFLLSCARYKKLIITL